MKAMLRTVLFLDALLSLALGVVFLLSPWKQLYASLQVPRADPAVYGQLLGVVLIGLAWLQWHATLNGQLTVTVARVSGHVNWICGAFILAWMFGLGLPVTGAGIVFLPALAAVLIVFAVFEIKVSHSVRYRERVQQNAKPSATPASPANSTAGAPAEPRWTPPSASTLPPDTSSTGAARPDSSASATQDARQNPHS